MTEKRKGRKVAGVDAHATEQQTQQGAFERLASMGFVIEHSASYEEKDGIVTREEYIMVWRKGMATVTGTGATFDEAFLDLGQKIVEASTRLMDLAGVVQEAINAALAANEAA